MSTAHNQPISNAEYGNSCEPVVLQWLRSRMRLDGIPASYRHIGKASWCKYDAIVNGKRTEIKSSRLNKDGAWLFNIHRHGLLDEDEVDVYILRLEDVPYCKKPIHLIFRAPLRVPTVVVSVRELIMGRLAEHVEATHIFKQEGKA